MINAPRQSCNCSAGPPASTTPSPDEEADSSATWSSGAELSGFEVVLEASDDAEGDDGAPGFGIGAALLAVLGGVALAVRGRPSA